MRKVKPFESERTGERLKMCRSSHDCVCMFQFLSDSVKDVLNSTVSALT